MVHFAKKKNTNGTFRETRKIKIWDLVGQIMLKADILEILGNFTSRHWETGRKIMQVKISENKVKMTIKKWSIGLFNVAEKDTTTCFVD